MKNIHLCLLLLLGAVVPQAAAQQAVKGKIFDVVTKEPVVGATVQILKNNAGTITDNNGLFVLPNVAIGAKISISSIGYASQEVEISDSNPLTVSLEPSVENLQTIVVTGNREAALRTETPIAISTTSSTRWPSANR